MQLLVIWLSSRGWSPLTIHRATPQDQQSIQAYFLQVTKADFFFPELSINIRRPEYLLIRAFSL
jgi:hypothetical protein